MAISVTQAASNASTSNASASVSFGSLPASTVAVIVAVILRVNFNSFTVAVTDNQSGNTYSQIDGIAGGSNSSDTFIFWCPSITAPSGTFTVTETSTLASGGGTAPEGEAIAIMAVSGLSGTVDQHATVSDVSGTATSGSVTMGSANTNANDLVIAIAGLGGYSGGSPTGISNPATSTGGAYTSWFDFDPDVFGTGAQGSYKIVSATETSNASWAWTLGASQWTAVLASLAAAATTSSITPSGGSQSISANAPSLIRGTVMTPQVARRRYEPEGASRILMPARKVFLPHRHHVSSPTNSGVSL